MESLSIAGRLIGPDHPPYIIAEIGANHNGDMALCRRLIDAARECGVDAVKFQSWSKSSLISNAEYARNTRYVKDKRVPSLEEAVEQCRALASFLGELFDKVSSRAELAAHAFDRQSAGETLKIYLGRA